jgi:hypothetical protein
MSATTKEKRERRVMARSIPEVLEAVQAGKLSLRLADQMLYLPRAKQRAELRRRLKAIEDRERISARVAGEIRQYLDTHTKVDLLELNRRLHGAVSAMSQ